MNVALALFIAYLVLLVVAIAVNHLIGRDRSLDADQ